LEHHVVTRKAKKKLVIVESPAKAKTINKYLGPDFEVAASKGHVRDLPKSKLGIDIAGGWVPTYLSLKDRKDVLKDLKSRATKAEAVYLAPDPDREGEAIAWHLKEALGLDDGKVHRVTFNEITKTAIQNAFAQPSQIDMDRVRAQETRRFLDRVVGYQLSPLLRKKVTRGLSAGRVQSVAVRLIAEREKEIEKFKPEEYWKITATLAKHGSGIRLAEPLRDADGKEQPAPLPDGAFLAELAEWLDKKFECNNGETAQQIFASLQQADYVVSKVEQKDRPEKAPAPFTTSTLQQQGSLRLRYSAKKTMMIAQRLYEGVELGKEGSVALITYMRTDSVRISNDALKMVRDHIGKKLGAAYLPEEPVKHTSGKSAQEGHEAIRPTDLAYTPQMVAKFLPQEQLKLYTLIYQRFVASQMRPAIWAVTNIEVKAGDGLFKAQGKVLKFDGFRKVYHPAGKQEDALLPPVKEQEALDCLNLAPTQHFTQPPPRYNEASLVKTLEKEGIGRPSTYASIISKIQERGYVEQKDRRFYCTKLGMLVTELLVEHFPKIMDVKFTSHMEDDLDQIEKTHLDWQTVLNEFYEPFSVELKEAEGRMPTVKGIESDEKCPQCDAPLVSRWSKRGMFWGCSKFPECKYIKPREGEEGGVQVTEHVCPECGKPLVQRMGKRGPFLSCSGYPECKTTMNIDAEGKAVPSATKTEHKCEKCGSPMVIREGKRGPFLACSGYPKCKNAKDVDAEGNPVQPIETGVKCEKCGGPMVVRKGPRGPFLGCGAYPKCRSIKNVKELPESLQELIRQRYPAPPKREGPKVEISDTCSDCGAPMKVRQGRRGPFLGCSKYPKCKGTKEASPELLEQLQGDAAA
jgi:DNA topoisomerase-1